VSWRRGLRERGFGGSQRFGGAHALSKKPVSATPIYRLQTSSPHRLIALFAACRIMRASRGVTRPSPLTSAASSCAPVAAIRSAITASAGRRGCRQSRDRRVRVRSTVTDAMPDMSEAVPAIWIRGIFSVMQSHTILPSFLSNSPRSFAVTASLIRSSKREPLSRRLRIRRDNRSGT